MSEDVPERLSERASEQRQECLTRYGRKILRQNGRSFLQSGFEVERPDAFQPLSLGSEGLVLLAKICKEDLPT